MGAYEKNEGTLRLARSLGRKIVAIGGGTGLSSLLLGLKEYTENITAIVTMTDDGGGSGVLREEYNVLPPGDIRNCILALANTSPSMAQVLSHRFASGSLKGQSFGNLFLLALNEVYGSFEAAVMQMGEILAITGRVLPVTTANVQLYAIFDDGKKILGETSITEYKKKTSRQIRHIDVLPQNATAMPEALKAISEADIIVLGPGSLYTSIIPNLIVPGINTAIARSNALKIYVLNVMTQDGETENYTAFQHVEELERYLGANIIDICLANSEKMTGRILSRYASEDAAPIIASKAEFKDRGYELVEAKMLLRAADYIRHDPLRLAYNIMKTACKKAPREGALASYDKLLLKDE